MQGWKLGLIIIVVLLCGAAIGAFFVQKSTFINHFPLIHQQPTEIVPTGEINNIQNTPVQGQVSSYPMPNGQRCGGNIRGSIGCPDNYICYNSSAPAGDVGGVCIPHLNITIEENGFSPQNATITSGTMVTWISYGASPCIVTADNGSFVSWNVAGRPKYPGAFDHLFTGAGTYSYHCQANPSRNGVLIVN